MTLTPVDEALRQILASATAPVDVEAVPLRRASGRTLARDLAALRTQPPRAVSAMDGYAVRAADVAQVPATLSWSAKARPDGASAARSGQARRPGSSPVRPCPRAPMPS